VTVPKIYDEFSNKRILTMSFEQGLNVNNLKVLKEKDINFRDLSKLISDTFVRMIF